MLQSALSISQLVGSIKDLLEGEYRNVLVEGEISNLSGSAAGHWYFTLSDADSSLSCALFKMDAMRNPEVRRLKNGDKVLVSGPISVYTKRGSFQLLAKKIIAAGKGDLHQQFLQLKQKLSAQGLFDVSEKRSIPLYPKKIGVITAQGAAALQDFLNVMQRRSLWYHIVLIPALVQGEKSAASLIKAIDKAQQVGDFDVLVLTRGGGSLEDLWSFNDEALVRKIYECDIPVISAVGHQVDYTLCDYVSDLRCETPTAAAETLSQPHTQLNDKMRHLGHRLFTYLQHRHIVVTNRLARIRPGRMVEIIQARLGRYQNRLTRLSLVGRVYDLTRLHESQQYLDELSWSLQKKINQRLSSYTHRLQIAGRTLTNLNPNAVLNRGYTYLSTEDGEVITNHRSFANFDGRKILNLHFSDGVGKVSRKDLSP